MSSSNNRTPLPSEPSQKAIEAHRREPDLDPSADHVSGTRKCFYCANRVPLDVRLCTNCKEKYHAGTRERYQKLKSEGKCPVCGVNKPDPGLTKCRACLLRQSTRKAEIRGQQGVLCSTCKRQLAYDDTGVCQSCKDSKKEQRTKKKEEEAKKTSNT